MPSTQLRKDVLTQARRIVVKIGTQVLTDEAGRLDVALLASIATQVAALRKRGLEVTIVSSGAVGAGCATLALKKRPTDITTQQAVAAVGQRGLMGHMHEAFAPHKLEVGQLLLTRADFDDRLRFLNIRNCIARLHQLGCVPIINENDTVAVDELRFGDNDTLAALVTNLLRADALVLLSVVDGLLDGDGNRVDMVDDLRQAAGLAFEKKSKLGTGGMKSKLEAARLVTDAGEIAVIANGREPDVLMRLFDTQKVGTVFVPAHRKLDSRQRWIGLTKRPSGTVTIDDGAVRALCERNKSLLATGVTEVTGRFDRGDVLMIRDPKGIEIARGLSNYSAEELRLIKGKRTSQFEKILGRVAYAEVVHRDNLVVTEAAERRSEEAT